MSTLFDLQHRSLSQLFPFYLIVDESLTAQSWGASLDKLFPKSLANSHLSALFNLNRPTIELTFTKICETKNLLYLLSSKHHEELRFRGQVIVSQENDQIAFLLSPWLSETRQIRKLGLTMNDFALHDPAMDLLHVIQSNHQGLADAKELARKLTHQKKQLTQANKELGRVAKMKDEFLANMSHELRTPLNTILGMSEALEEQVYGPLTDKQVDSIVSINESGQHLLSLINDILDLSKLSVGKIERNDSWFSVSSLCQASLNLVREAAQNKGIKIHLSIEMTTERIYADQRRLKQVLVNLLSNAIKFTPDGKKIGLKVTEDLDASELQMCVWDEGIGISSEEQKHLFQPFVQLDSKLSRNYEGTGLGLSLVKKLVELHDGRVSLESQPSLGSRFTVVLPLEQEQDEEHHNFNDSMAALPQKPPPSAPKEPKAEPKGEKTKILLAEDNESNIKVFQTYLNALGYDVSVARNGYEALEQAPVYQPALIIMDIQMPGMDGLETMQQLRQRECCHSTPIIALTALAMPKDKERCLAAGANKYLTKPIPLKDLREVIKELLQNEAAV